MQTSYFVPCSMSTAPNVSPDVSLPPDDDSCDCSGLDCPTCAVCDVDNTRRHRDILEPLRSNRTIPSEERIQAYHGSTVWLLEACFTLGAHGTEVMHRVVCLRQGGNGLGHGNCTREIRVSSSATTNTWNSEFIVPRSLAPLEPRSQARAVVFNSSLASIS